MKSIFYITIILPLLLQAAAIPQSLQNPLLYEEQRKIYEEQQKEAQDTTSVYTELKAMPLTKDDTSSKTCIDIESIEIQNATRLDDQVLHELSKPYIDRCNTMHDINTLVKKINNLYIEKAYVTSRAYIKPQDLSKGHLTITVMEGKIEAVRGKEKLEEITKGKGINDVFRSQVAPEDFVGSFLWYQSAGINNSENLVENMGTSILSAGRLFDVGGASTHSYYGCVIGCGDNIKTPQTDFYFTPNNIDGTNETPLSNFYLDIKTDSSKVIPIQEPSVVNSIIIDTTRERKDN